MACFSIRTMALGSSALAVTLRSFLAGQTAFAQEVAFAQNGDDYLLAICSI